MVGWARRHNYQSREYVSTAKMMIWTGVGGGSRSQPALQKSSCPIPRNVPRLLPCRNIDRHARLIHSLVFVPRVVFVPRRAMSSEGQSWRLCGGTSLNRLLTNLTSLSGSTGYLNMWPPCKPPFDARRTIRPASVKFHLIISYVLLQIGL